MTGTDIQGRVQRLINDPGGSWTPTQYIDATNHGMVSVANARANANDSAFVFPLAVVNGQEQPVDFIKFAGTNPIEQRNLGAGGIKWYYTGSVQPTVKYYRYPPAIAALSETIYFPAGKFIEALVLSAAIYLQEQRGVYKNDEKYAKLAALLA